MYYSNNSETRYSITESNLQYLNNLHYSIVNKTLDTGRIQGMAIGIIIGIFLTVIFTIQSRFKDTIHKWFSDQVVKYFPLTL